MSVQNLAVLNDLTRTLLGARRRCRCFFCHHTIKDIAVVWYGASAITLHPRCAQKLATRLSSDGFTAERILRGKPLLGGVDRTLLPVGEA